MHPVHDVSLRIQSYVDCAQNMFTEPPTHLSRLTAESTCNDLSSLRAVHAFCCKVQVMNTNCVAGSVFYRDVH